MYSAEFALALLPADKEAAAQLRLLLNSFYRISEGKKPLHQIKAVYEVRALCEAGYMPALLCCSACNRYDGTDFYFDVQGGNLLCADCAQKNGRVTNLDGAALTALRHAALVEDKKIFSFAIPEESLRQLARIAEQYAMTHLDRPIKTLGFLKSVL